MLALQSALAVPVADNALVRLLPRNDTVVVDPPKDPKPDITEIPEMTWEELQELIDQFKDEGIQLDTRTYGIDELAARNEQLVSGDTSLMKRQSGTSKDGPFLSFLDGEIKPGADPKCEDFTLNGPFTNIHVFMGSSNLRGIKATSYSGNTSELHSNVSLADAEFTFADNERITKFSIARSTADSIYVSGLRFDTDAGNSFEVLATIFSIPDANAPTWQDIPVGSGILARLRGTNCDSSLEIFGSFGVDFLDELNSISISNIDYEGFANSIMPSGRGTQLSIGSQILDNRNSSVSQTITLTTTDAVTESRTVNTQIRALVGGSVAVEGKVGVPLISEGSVRTEANWQLETLNNDAEMVGSTTTRAATFALACPAGKFCTANAFFMQYKVDVNMNATFTATTKSGSTFNWIQGGTYKGADSLAMQFNVTEVDRVS
ncbi:hypothetical protein Daus18300_003872 [Diaporthe australafricana]|uniref:Natterin-like protein n=1 Tax=Diaporthe australafricana TaxID=127596 RepID=A0ABR3XD17_9PEZI